MNMRSVLTARRGKQILALSLLLLAVVVALVVLFNNKAQAKLIISSEQGAEIYIAHSQGEDLQKIGVTVAEYSTKDLPQDVFIFATLEDKKTSSYISLDEARQYEVNLSLKRTVEFQKVTDGSISNIHISGDLVQGIVPETSSITSFSISSFEPPRSEIISIPQLKKIVWYDRDNFIYAPYNNSVGRFINGKDEHTLIKEVFPSPSLENIVGDDREELTFADVAKVGGKPLVLISYKSLYESDDLGGTVKEIAELEPNDNQGRLFADSHFIYVIHEQPPGAYASDYEDKKGVGAEDNDEQGRVDVTQYDYNGSLINSVNLKTHQINGIASDGDTVYAIDDNNLYIINGESVNEAPLYFKYLRSLIEYKDAILLLADNGIWRIDDGGSMINLIFGFNDYGVGLKDSLSEMPDGGLVFSTQRRPEEQTSNNAVFVLGQPSTLQEE